MTRNNSQTIMNAFAVSILGLTVLFGSSEASAAPKWGAPGGRCDCNCSVTGRSEILTIAETVYGCHAAEGKTCNLSDPATGGVRSGKITFCIPRPTGPLYDPTVQWHSDGGVRPPSRPVWNPTGGGLYRP